MQQPTTANWSMQEPLGKKPKKQYTFQSRFSLAWAREGRMHLATGSHISPAELSLSGELRPSCGGCQINHHLRGSVKKHNKTNLTILAKSMMLRILSGCRAVKPKLNQCMSRRTITLQRMMWSLTQQGQNNHGGFILCLVQERELNYLRIKGKSTSAPMCTEIFYTHWA